MSDAANGAKKVSARQAEMAVYADLFERLLEPTFLVDPVSFKILDANKAAKDVLGFDKRILIGRHLVEMATPDEREHLNKHLRDACRRYYPRLFDCRWMTKGGRMMIMELAACLLKLANNDEVLQVIARDVTRSRQAEEKAAEYLAELTKANAKLEQLTVTDHLTGVANLRHFKNELLIEHNRAVRYGTPYAVLTCEVDEFQKYTDRNGHDSAEEVLCHVARILKEKTRTTDLPARHGGEKFLVLCRGSDKKGANALAQRVRHHVEEDPVFKVSVSIGIASFPADGIEPGQILHAADQALGVARAQGMNKVVLAESGKFGDEGMEEATEVSEIMDHDEEPMEGEGAVSSPRPEASAPAEPPVEKLPPNVVRLELPAFARKVETAPIALAVPMESAIEDEPADAAVAAAEAAPKPKKAG